MLADAQPWHADHGFGDLCVACHGGDAAAATRSTAHVGLRDPLADPSLACAGCHNDDAAQRAERYALASVKAANSAASNDDSAPPTTPHVQSAIADRVLAVLALLLAAAIHRVGRREQRVTWSLARWLRDKTWSPYAAGVLLGLVVAFSEVVYGRPLAVAGAFDKLAAYPGRWLFPTSQYYRYLMTPGITWQVWLVIGVLIGAFVSSKLSDEARLRWLPDTQWRAQFGGGRPRRLIVAFAGAVLVQVGAGIAGGCTSGLAISGGTVLAPSAFLFMAGMFVGGIPSAWLWYRRRSD